MHHMIAATLVALLAAGCGKALVVGGATITAMGVAGAGISSPGVRDTGAGWTATGLSMMVIGILIDRAAARPRNGDDVGAVVEPPAAPPVVTEPETPGRGQWRDVPRTPEESEDTTGDAL